MVRRKNSGDEMWVRPGQSNGRSRYGLAREPAIDPGAAGYSAAWVAASGWRGWARSQSVM